jgi:hypothetical protein
LQRSRRNSASRCLPNLEGAMPLRASRPR